MKRFNLMFVSLALAAITSCGGGQNNPMQSSVPALSEKDQIAYNCLIRFANDTKAGWHDKTSVRYVRAYVSFETAGLEGFGGSVYCAIRGTNALGAYLTQNFHIMLNTDYSYKYYVGPEKDSTLFEKNNVDISAVNAKIDQYWGL